MVFRSFRALFSAAALLSGSALAAPTAISYLTHWSPETVAKLEAAAKEFNGGQSRCHHHRACAVPFGDLLTTIRSQGSSAESPTIASIYDLWLPELARDKLVEPAPKPMPRKFVGADWPAGVVGRPGRRQVLRLSQ